MADFTFAIGDIHGCAGLLEQLLTDAARRGSFNLVTLGDYVDRGADVPAVIDMLLGDIPGCDGRTCLLGNHEDMMFRTLQGDATYLDTWLTYGGRDTLESYGIDPDAVEAALLSGESVSEFQEALPPEHWRFLSGLPVRHEDAAHIYVHAGLDPRVALDDQTPHAMMWIRGAFLSSEHDFGKLVVHGHTPDQYGPSLAPNRLNLDTGAVYGGPLCGAILTPDVRDPDLILTTDPDRRTVTVRELRARTA